jgi:hypothetical protein
LYQKDTPVPLLGRVNVWLMVESPFVGEVLPTRAQYVPAWHPELTTEAVPVWVHPVSVPASKPPLVIAPPPVPPVTVRAKVALCVAEPSVPVTVMVYEPDASALVVEILSVALPPAVTEVGET